MPFITNFAIAVKIINFLTQVPMSECQSRVQWRESVQHASGYSAFHVQRQECGDCRRFGRHTDSVGCYWWLDEQKVNEKNRKQLFINLWQSQKGLNVVKWLSGCLVTPPKWFYMTCYGSYSQIKCQDHTHLQSYLMLLYGLWKKSHIGTSKIFLSNILLNISSNSDIYRANTNTSWGKLFNDFVMRKNNYLHNSDWMTNENGIWKNLSKKKDISFNPITLLKRSQPIN